MAVKKRLLAGCATIQVRTRGSDSRRINSETTLVSRISNAVRKPVVRERTRARATPDQPRPARGNEPECVRPDCPARSLPGKGLYARARAPRPPSSGRAVPPDAEVAP